jgi:hypothetical protein
VPDATSTLGDTSLPKFSKADLLKRYRARVKDAVAWREREKYDAVWKRMVDMYKGKHFEASTTSEDRIAVNIAFATINTIEPSIAINSPKITVYATDESKEDQATICEAVINYWWRHDEVKPEFRRAAKDFLIFGHGWLKVGYRYAEGEKERAAEEVQKDQEDMQAQADDFAAANPGLAGDVPTNEDIAAGIPTTEPFIITDQPFVERVSPWDIYVDPEATCLADMKWIAQKIVRPLEDVKADNRFPSAVRSRLKSDSTRADAPVSREPTAQAKDNSDTKRVTLWEFYDMQRHTVCVFTDTRSVDDSEFLLKPEPQPYTYGMPYVMFRSYDVPDQFYPIGDLEMLEPLQGELNKTRSAMMNNRKRYARKYMYHADSITPTAADALISDVDGALVPIEDPNVDLKAVVVPVPQVPLDAQMYQYSETIEKDLDRVSGVSEYQQGSIPAGRQTATEASIIQDAANSRAADKLSQIEEVVRHVAYRLVALAQQYMSGEQVVRVTGPDGANLWVNFDRHDIAGEFDFQVEAGSTQPRNDTQRKQQAMQLFNTLLPFAQPLGPGAPTVVDPAVLVEYLLREGFDVKNPQKFLSPPPPPMPVDPATGQPLQLPPQGQGGPPQLNAGPQGPLNSTPSPQSGAPTNVPGAQGFNGLAPNVNGGGALGIGAQK